MRRAYTLVELLVVIGIVLVLIMLLIPALSMLRDMARATSTAARLDQVVQGLSGLSGSAGRRPVDLIHERAVAPNLLAQGLPTGVREFVVSHETNIRFAMRNGARVLPAALDGNYISATAPQCLPFPWGQPTLDPTSGEPTTTRHPFAMPAMDPTATVELMVLAGVDVDATRWATDRGLNRPFNDAWGHPLVIGYALYQPLRNTAVTVRTRQVGATVYMDASTTRNVVYEDLFVTQAERTYQFSKAIYFAAASAGPTLAAPLSGSVAPADLANDQRAVWSQANEACRGAEWGAEAWSAPPWRGIRRGRGAVGGVVVRSSLSAPVMVK